LEARAEMAMPTFKPPQAEFIDADFVEFKPEPQIAQPSAEPEKILFATDAELALWVLDHPEEALPRQINVLVDAVNIPFERQHLRDLGVDVDRLIPILNQHLNARTENTTTGEK
jgi:hypothetical protein